MKIYITWVLLFMIGQQINGIENYDHDYEIFHTDHQNLKSQSLYPSPDLQSTNYYYNDDYDNDANSHNLYRRYADYKLSQLAPISAEPEITKLPLYVSPDSISHRFVRSPQSPGHRDYINSYKDFLDKHFSRSYHADDNEQNAKYQQNDKQSERQSEYAPRFTDDAERHNVPSSSGGGGHRDYNYNDEYERIRKLSQDQEKTIQQNPKNCKTEIRGSMKCSVCVDPKSGDNSESCAFSATPTDNKYAYTRERNYDSKNDDNDNQSKPSKKKSEYKLTENNNQHPQKQQKQQLQQEDQHQQKQQQQQQQTTETPRYRPRTRRPKTTLSTASETLASLINEPNQKSAAIRQEPKQSLKTYKKQQKRDENKKYRSSYKAEESRPQRDVIGLDPFLYGSGGGSSGAAVSDGPSDKSFGYDYYASKLSDYAHDKSNNNNNNDNKNNNNNNNNNDNDNNNAHDNNERSQNLRSYEDYFAHVFPETKHSASEPIYEQPENIEILPGYESNKNVADVLAEFKKKDWSTCSKSNRGDLTCYNCKDDKGVKHEECMYESAANPTKSRLAYTELKEYHDSDGGDYGKDSHGGSSDIVSRISKNNSDDEKKNNDKININGKSRRSVVIKKRKLTDDNKDKLETTSATPLPSASVPKPEDIFENQSGEKRTFKRTVSFRIEKNGEVDPDKSKILVFEHNYSQED